MKNTEDRKTGFYWHVHHEILLEWCYDYDERVDYIKTEKPEEERELRLRLFQPVRGDLPKELVEAGNKYDKIQKKHDKAWKKYIKAKRRYNEIWEKYGNGEEEYRKAYNKREKTWMEYERVWTEFNAVRNEYIRIRRRYRKEIEELHKQECIDCPWNGNTIFPRKG